MLAFIVGRATVVDRGGAGRVKRRSWANAARRGKSQA